MSGITVYGIPGSPFLRTVEVVLKEKEVPYHLHVMGPGELKVTRISTVTPSDVFPPSNMTISSSTKPRRLSGISTKSSCIHGSRPSARRNRRA